MRSLIVGSINPVKIQAALQAFEIMFPSEKFEIQGFDVPSGVNDQPMSEDESWQGAVNRAKRGQLDYPQAHYWIGLEAGLTKTELGYESYGIVAVLSSDKLGRGKTASYLLPSSYTAMLEQGLELGAITDTVFQLEHTKRQQGTVGLLTGNALSRTDSFKIGVMMALIPFKNSHLYN